MSSLCALVGVLAMAQDRLDLVLASIVVGFIAFFYEAHQYEVKHGTPAVQDPPPPKA